MQLHKVTFKVEKIMPLQYAHPPLELARNLHTPGGQLLFHRGQVLSSLELTQAKRFNLHSIPVREETTQWVSEKVYNKKKNDYSLLESREIKKPDDQPIPDWIDLLDEAGADTLFPALREFLINSRDQSQKKKLVAFSSKLNTLQPLLNKNKKEYKRRLAELRSNILDWLSQQQPATLPSTPKEEKLQSNAHQDLEARIISQLNNPNHISELLSYLYNPDDSSPEYKGDNPVVQSFFKEITELHPDDNRTLSSDQQRTGQITQTEDSIKKLLNLKSASPRIQKLQEMLKQQIEAEGIDPTDVNLPPELFKKIQNLLDNYLIDAQAPTERKNDFSKDLDLSLTLSGEVPPPKKRISHQRKNIIFNAVKSRDLKLIKEKTALPENILKEYFIRFSMPDSNHKWFLDLIERYKKILEGILFIGKENQQSNQTFIERFFTVWKNQKRPFMLLSASANPDEYLLVHSFNRTLIALLLTGELEMPPAAQNTLLTASCLADIGMLWVPASMYLEQKKLTPRGRGEINAHPLRSARLTEHLLGNKNPAISLVLNHHRRSDASGYPPANGNGKTDPLSQILAVADDYTARLENRIHRPALAPNIVLEKLLMEGKHSLQLTNTLAKKIGYYPTGCIVRLSDNSLALVHSQSSDFKKPDVILIADAQGNRLDDVKRLNLKNEPLTVKKILRT